MMPLPRFQLPMSAANFLAAHWQRSPLLMRQAASGLDVVDGDTLAGLALEDKVDSRLIEGASEGPWQLRQGPFTEADFAALPAHNWTLLVQSVDHYLTEASLLLDSFSFLPAWRIEDIMISYANCGGGVGPHFDHYDVFLVQASGTRRWKIGPKCDQSTPLQDHPSLKLLENMQVTHEFLLEAGDVLYLPPGIAHWGSAESDDCITWSVGLRAPELYQMIDWLLAESEADRTPMLYQDAGRQDNAVNSGLDDGSLSDFMRQATAALSALPCRSLLSRWLSLPRQDTLELVDVNKQLLLSIDPKASLARHGGCRLLAEDHTMANVWINGEHYDVPEPARALVSKLLEKRLFKHQELEALLTHHSAQNLLKEWIDKRFFSLLND